MCDSAPFRSRRTTVLPIPSQPFVPYVMNSTPTLESPRISVADKVPFGILAFAGAGMSVAFCFAKTIVLTILPLIGFALVEFEFNPHVQAALMSLFVLVGVVGLGLDKSRCGSATPFAIGIVSFIIIAGTLYVYYVEYALTMGYVVLLIAAFLNLSLRLRRLNHELAA